MNGIIILDKPRGPTCHQIDSWIKEILGTKVGHIGTLDPHASGVLPILVGKAVKLTKYLQKSDKEYVFLISGKLPKEVLPLFTGKIYQTPPKESAVKKQTRIRTVYSIRIIESNNYTLLKANVQHGTYIRSLVHDFSRYTGQHYELLDLRRTKVNGFHENECVILQEIEDAMELFHKGDDSKLKEVLRPLEYAVKGLKKVWIKRTCLNSVKHGWDISAPGIIRYDRFNKGDYVAVFHENTLIAVGITTTNWKKIKKGRGKIIRVEKVFV